MRGKRSKQYRKLMQQYGIYFGFREPYQVLLDGAILQDAARFRMNFVAQLEKTLHGRIKPMITQCCIRHLYSSEPKDSELLKHAKAFERRYCNHHELDEPLNALECLASVVDPKSTKNNKHRYIVATQDPKIRAYMRAIPGTPLIYLHRSVMIMEPMANSTEAVRKNEERAKFRAGLKGRRGGPYHTEKQKEHSEAASRDAPSQLSGLSPADDLASSAGKSLDNAESLESNDKQNTMSLSEVSQNEPVRLNVLPSTAQNIGSRVTEHEKDVEIQKGKRKRRHKPTNPPDTGLGGHEMSISAAK